jgi:hypothetical protein
MKNVINNKKMKNGREDLKSKIHVEENKFQKKEQYVQIAQKKALGKIGPDES